LSNHDGELSEMVLGWAKNNEDRCTRWLTELEDNSIRNMEALVKVAAYLYVQI